MVAIVSGNNLGLNLGSLALLGQQGAQGAAAHGSSGERVYVNAASGNLVLQTEDERLAGRGPDAVALRTYNSQGLLNDDNGDGWTSGTHLQPLALSGTLNAAGSTLRRTDRDGATSLYSYDTARGLYRSTDGDGAHDSIAFIAADNQLEWRDGSTGLVQRYEAAGAFRLLATRDPAGQALTYAYNAAGRLASVLSASGETTFYDYAGNNLTQLRTVSSSGATATRVRYSYDASNRLATVTVDLSPADNAVADGLLLKTTYSYDGSSRRVSKIVQSDGSSLTLAYTLHAASGSYRVESITNALNQKLTFAYSATAAGVAGSTTVTDPLGAVTTLEYDAAGRLTRLAGPAVNGAVAERRFGYNSAGDVLSVTDGLGRVTSYEYDANGNQTLQRDAAGNTVSRSFDARNQLLTETVYAVADADGAGTASQPSAPLTTRYVYDAGGRNLLRFVLSAEGRVTEHRYNGLGERTATLVYGGATYGVGALALTAVPTEADMATWAATQSAGPIQRQDLAYDARGELQSRTRYARTDAQGAGVSDGSQARESYVYDSAGRLLQVVSPTGGSSLFTYDGLGRVLTSSNALGQVTSYQYGNESPTSVTLLPNGLVRTAWRDANGRLTALEEGPSAGAATLGRTRYFYDGADRLRMTEDPTGVRSWVLYNESGRKAAEVDGNGSLTEYGYDRNDLLVATTRYATAVNLALLADAAGQPILATTLATLRPAATTGDVREWRAYDSARRLVKVARTVGTGTGVAVTEMRYDAASRLTGTIAYANLVDASAVQPGAIPTPAASASHDRVTRRFHDADGLLKGSLAAEGFLVAFNHDAAGRQVERIAYASATDPAKRASGTLAELVPAASAADIRAVTLYDGQGRVVGEVDGENDLTETLYDASGNVTRTVRYATRLANGVAAGSSLGAIRPAATAADRATNRSYDALNRVKQETNPEGTVTQFSYDSAGNLVSTVRAAGTAEARTQPARYDLQGRLTGELSAEGAARLTAGQTPAEVDAVWRQYGSFHAYDAAGRRISTTAPGGARTLFFYDADGQRTHTINALGEVRESKYDVLGRRVEELTYTLPVLTKRSGADFSGDGTADIAWRHAGTGADSLWRSADAAQGQTLASVADLNGQIAGIGDFNGDLVSDLLWRNAATGDNVIWRAGNSATTQPVATLADTAWKVAGVGDFNNDGVSDMLWRHAGTGANVLWRSADAAQARQLTAQADPNWKVAGTGDFNGDGVTDILWNNEGTGSSVIWRGGDSTRAQAVAAVSAGWKVAGTGDFNNDGNDDILWRHAVSGDNAIWNAADLNQPLVVAPVSDLNWSVVAVGDFNRDGSADLLWRHAGSGAQVIWRSARLETTQSVAAIADASWKQPAQVSAPTWGLRGGLVNGALTAALAAAARSTDMRLRYAYTRDDQLRTAWDALGNATTRTYNAFGEEIQRDEAVTGGTLSVTHSVDRRGLRLATVTDASNTFGVNNVVATAYDAFGRVIRTVDANGNTREQSFDRLGRVVTSKDPLGSQRSSSYDAFDRVLTQTDALGSVTRYAYDAAARTMSVTTPEGIRTTTAFTRHGQVLSVTDGRNFVTTSSYDRDGRLLATQLPSGARVSNSYDAAGRLVQTVDAAGGKVAYVYDAADRVLTRTLDPDGLKLVTSYQYDTSGLQVTVTDPAGTVTKTEYDARGQVLKQTDDPAGLNLQTTYSYDPGGRVLSVASPGGTVTQYGYDALGRRRSELVDPGGLKLQRSWSYDKAGNLVGSTDATGNLTRHAYDAGGRLAYTVDALGNVCQDSYDAEGRVTRTVRYATPIATASLSAAPTVASIQLLVVASTGRDAVEHRVYDRDGRLAATVDGSGAVQRFVYDANGNVTWRAAYATRINLASWVAGTLPTVVANDARDQRSMTVYDSLNRAAYTMDCQGAVVATSYDGNGRVLKRTAYAAWVATSTPLTESAMAAAVAAVANPARDAVLRNTYDAAGRLAWSVDGTGAVTQRVYDRNGNLVKQVAHANAISATANPATVSASGNDRVASMAYDTANRLVLQVDALNAVTESVYDGNGNLVRQVAYANPIASVPALGTASSADDIRKLLLVHADNRVTRHGYDAAGRRELSIDALGAATQTSYDGAGRAVSVTAYAKPVVTSNLSSSATLQDMKPLVSSKPGEDRVTRSVYDAAGRLAYAVDALWAVEARQYDGVGRLTRTTRYAATFENTTLTLAGMTTAAAAKATAATDQVELFEYNAAGQLVKTTDALGYTESFSFDAIGRKLGFTDKRGATWSYGYDASGRLVSEVAPKIDVTRMDVDNGVLKPIVEEDVAAVTSFRYDALGNLIERREAAGRQEERVTGYEYDAAGRQVVVKHPAANVYNPSADAVTVNGASSLASRTELLNVPNVTRTWYDALGNAVANVDAAGALSQKAYDRMGRLAYDVDALGYVTGYGRNAFGEVTSLDRYAKASGLASRTVTQWSHAATKAQVEAALNAAGFKTSQDRTLRTRYDGVGRVTEVLEPVVWVVDFDEAGNRRAGDVGKTTVKVYDAFGQVLQDKSLRNAGVWSVTTRVYDKAGRERETRDALNYLTRRTYDSFGNLTELNEFAQAGSRVNGSFVAPAESADDRKTVYAYNRRNEQTSETRKSVEIRDGDSGASTIRRDVTTRFTYDAAGNQVSVTDARDGISYTYRDALGRIEAIAAPARTVDIMDGKQALRVPLTVYQRDIHGNAVVTREFWNGAASASAAQFTPGDPNGPDRTSMALFDRQGRVIQSTDAAGADVFQSYDVSGNLAKKWQGVTIEGGTRTWFELNTYDALGRLTETFLPRSTSVYQGNGVIATVAQSQAGLDRTTYTYNAFGELTNRDLNGTPHEYFAYDNAGRLWRTNSGDGVARVQLYDAQGHVTSELRSAGSGGAEIDLAQLDAKSADLNLNARRVDTRYDALGRVIARVEAAREEVQGGVEVQRQFITATVDESASAVRDEGSVVGVNGRNVVRLSWNSLASLGSGDVKVTVCYSIPSDGTGYSTSSDATGYYTSAVLAADVAAAGARLEWTDTTRGPIGIQAVTRVIVYKKMVDGSWEAVIDQGNGVGANTMQVAAPRDPNAAMLLELRTAGTAGDGGWWAVPLHRFGDANWWDARDLAVGDYEYRVRVANPGENYRISATGTAHIRPAPLNTITTPIRDDLESGLLCWARQDSSLSQELHYRLQGSGGAWSSLSVQNFDSFHDGVDLRALGAGTYEFELLWRGASAPVATDHATGTFTVTAARPPVWVPPVNVPNITGVTGAVQWDGVYAGEAEDGGGPVYIGGTGAWPAVQWDAVNANGFRYRLPGAQGWNEIAIDNQAQFYDQENGRYGGHQRALLKNVPPGRYELWIHLYSPPVVQATGFLEVRGRYDQPLITLNTPPYTPGYWTQPVPAQYDASVTTAVGSGAISTTAGTTLAKNTGLNGDTRQLRPIVLQKNDRWGNVIERTDPRVAAWKTSYRYDASNRMVQQTLPDANGAISSTSPVTQIIHDQLGRQVAVKDANGFVTEQVYDAAGQLVEERHPDTGVLRYRYTIFGDRTYAIDAEGNTVTFAFDKLGRMEATAKGVAPVHAPNDGKAVVVDTRNIMERWEYDQLGRRTSHTNGNGEKETFTYDLRGNVVATTQPLGQVTRSTFAFDAQGRKVAQVDAIGNAMLWSYDSFGRLRDHIDLGGNNYDYSYDSAGQLIAQNHNRGQALGYKYDAAGQVVRITDWATGKVTSYTYDLGGRRIGERVTQGGATYQDNHLSYDARGNLRDVADARVHVQMDYDKVGNRTRIETSVDYQGVSSEVASHRIRYFQYDAMNRQVVVDAVDATMNISKGQGHRLTYDRNGNRTSDTYIGNSVRTSGGESIIAWYNEDGSAVYTTTPVTFTKVPDSVVVETYRYDKLNRLTSVVRDGLQLDVRLYDGADRVIQSGPVQQLHADYTRIINEDRSFTDTIGQERRLNRYDVNGRILRQQVYRTDNGASKSDVIWNPPEKVTVNGTTYTPGGYDNAGNVLGYVVQNVEGAYVNEYRNGFKRFEGYMTEVTAGTSSKFAPGSTTQQYDPNGFLTAITDSAQPLNNRTFVNDAEGRALFVNQGGNVQRQLIVNGEVLGIYGAGPSATSSSANPSFDNLVDFDFGYSRISASYPNPAPGVYTTRAGDTLQSIAYGAYGDSALWYRIAEANGLTSNSDLRAGQTLTIPNRVSSIHNNNTTFKPYDPSRIEGDKTPYLPMPANDKGCGGVGQVLMIVVAIIVTIYTAGAAAAAWGAFSPAAAAAATASISGTFSAGLAVITGTTVGGVSVAAGGAAMAVAAAAAGGAVGSIASQLVGMATGVQERFNWKGVALSALATGVSAGLAGPSSPLTGGSVGHVVARAAIGNMATQGIGVAAGLQKRFDWKGVAAAAAGSFVGQAAGGLIGDAWSGPVGEFGKRMVSGLAAGAAARLVGGNRVTMQQVAVDAFGNALGSSLADAPSGSGTKAREDLQPGQLGSGTYPGVDDFVTPTLFGGGRPVGPVKSADDVMRLNDDTRVISDWDPEGRQGDADSARLLFDGRPLADRGLGYRAPQQPASVPGDPAAGQAFLDNVSEVLRETRGMGPSRASMYRDFAVSGKFGQLDRASQAVALAGMVSYADTLNQTLIAEGVDGRTADAAVRYATDAAKQSNAIPEQWIFGSHSRMGAAAGILMLHMPVRQQYEIPYARAAGETEATALGKSYHAQRATQRRASGDYDMVNEPFVWPNGQPIMVTRRVNLNTGDPVPESGIQLARPDSVVFKREVVIDDKPIGRPLSKDQQEILRFIRAYEAQFGAPPRTIAIERYDRVTMKPVVTELYKPSDFPLKKK
ncbi:MAG TPA: FG-GAP-like repeat-containing protein [Ramlibacter sp.]|nr:FG-GAP-like repeat-containing protein [Ramlibacter sp.]